MAARKTTPTVAPTVAPTEQYDPTKHEQARCKCGNCGLHFVICTWRRHAHTKRNVICPECGLKSVVFIWRAVVDRPVFTVVPGGGELDRD